MTMLKAIPAEAAGTFANSTAASPAQLFAMSSTAAPQIATIAKGNAANRIARFDRPAAPSPPRFPLAAVEPDGSSPRESDSFSIPESTAESASESATRLGEA